MKFKLLGMCAAMALAGAAQATTYVYVGSWAVADGPLWTTDPASLSGQDTAALLWGGAASDYAISTIDSNPLNINFSAHLDGYADTTYLTGIASQSFKLQTGSGYATYPSFSAYVFDHACGIYYCDGGGGDKAINFAFRAVPEPASWALMIVGFGMVGATMRRRQTVTVTYG